MTVPPDPSPLGPGYVHVYTGDGKGKTTAAVGLAVRAVGAGLKVFFGQLIKEGRYGEIGVLERLGGAVVCRQYGRGCWLGGEPQEEDRRLAREGLVDIRAALLSGEFQLVVVDEASVATWFGLLSVDDLLDLVDARPHGVELVFTGRKADPRLIERADVVTEMREVAHYYQRGVLARDGIER
ncbi:MAG: cob(I)yrinic acid a,c-diamide adenosyltransferase [Deltaproteobacteria bacterium]|nr:cob(I)yrinic acid a,c-diamide adenosyltransferase [Deltaproteobacteria bacterium]